jgi:transcription elongation factor Elf1
MKLEAFTCPVCGYPALSDAPRTQSGGGSYEICPSCGFQFGVTDEDQGRSYEDWRAEWIHGGMKWQSQGLPEPPGWDPRMQMIRAGISTSVA